ncbi:Rap1a/Tai family immunity protein [Paraburkholderia fungorum]|uniref:Rap1a/Tai family immunity protein n=1 Tax=Paraburkholderia fungorum TaxID=134537 RepID=UPI00402B4CBE
MIDRPTTNAGAAMSMKMWLGAGLLCMALSAVAVAQNSMVLSFVNGNAYQRFDRTSRMVYIEGVLDGLAEGLSANPQDQTAVKALVACTAHMDAGQVEAIVEKYLADNPTQWDWPMNMLTYNAMANACAVRGFRMSN